jgi:hypothetical protein
MGLEEDIDGYLGIAREDVREVALLTSQAEMRGLLDIRIAKRNAARDELAARGHAIVLPILQVATAKLSGIAPPNPESLYGGGPTVGLIKCIVANAQEVVVRIGPTAIPALLAAALDPTPAVRSLAAASLALLKPDRGDIALLEQLYRREEDPATRVAMAGALLYFARLCSHDGLARARREVTPWLDRQQLEGDWRSWVRRQGGDQDSGLGLLVVADQLDLLVYPQARALA